MLFEKSAEDVRIFRKEKVEKRRPDGSTYEATRSVRVSKRTGKDL